MIVSLFFKEENKKQETDNKIERTSTHLQSSSKS